MNTESNKTFFPKLFDIAKRTYHKTPFYLRWILWPVRFIYKYVRIFRPDMWIIVGYEKSSGQELGIAFAGNELNKNYLISLIFDNPEIEDYLGKKWLWRIYKVANRYNPKCSLVVTEIPYWLNKLRKKQKSFYIPNLVYGKIDISNDNLTSLIYKNTSLKSDIAKIKKNELSFDVTKETSELYNFHYNMLLPHILRTFHNQAFIPDYKTLEREFIKNRQSFDLIMIKKNQEYIAGSLLHNEKNKTRLRAVGIKDGNIEYIQNGAMGAVFYFSVRHSIDIGKTIFDFGGSRPFFNDGVLKYKNKWKQNLYNIKETGFLFEIISSSYAIKEFFLNNPFIYAGKTGLYGALFVTKDYEFSNDFFKKIDKQYLLKGLSKLVIFQLGKNETNKPTIVPQQYSDKIEFYSTENIF